MYEYITGVVKKITPKYIVVDNNKIGYLIIVGNPYDFKVDEEYQVYLYQAVREDSLDLYGFKSFEIKEAFISLLSVKGIGPKSALSMVSASNPTEIYGAIERADVKFLTNFPGIGLKASQQIILDLKGKINFEENDNLSAKLLDCEEALVALGYNKKDINKTLKQIDSELDINQTIKQALKLLSKVA